MAQVPAPSSAVAKKLAAARALLEQLHSGSQGSKDTESTQTSQNSQSSGGAESAESAESARGGHARIARNASTSDEVPVEGAAQGAKPRRPYRGPSLRARALKMLSVRDLSAVELRRKLAPITVEMGHDAEQGAALVDALLADFAERGWQSDERFAASLARRRSKFGNARLAQELKSHQLPKATVSDTLEAAKGDECERALVQWQKKFGAAPADAKERAKQMRFLIARGFGAEVVHKVVHKAAGSASSEDEPGEPY